jgi:hypothetical protein
MKDENQKSKKKFKERNMETKKKRNDKRKSKLRKRNGRKKKDRNACSCCTDWQYESISFTQTSSIIK